MRYEKKALATVLSVALACALCVPVLSLAEEPAAGNDDTGTMVSGESSESSVPTAQSSEPADDCTATILFYEYADYYDPDYPLDESGRIFLGERTITGLHEGEVLDAWDYVADIPGHFFYDGWPAKLTVSTDPSKNVFEFMYFKKYEYEYTVNYYLMLGADLTADSWAGALAPEGVEFIKLGSETFTDQRMNQLVVGDAYEYQLDGMYVIDTYPAEIRVGLDADDNVINVLYTPDSVNLPDDFEIPDDVYSGEPGDGDDSGDTDADDPAEGPSDSDGDDPEAGAPDEPSDGDEPADEPSDGEFEPTLPPDESMDKDDLIQLLPDAVQVPTDEASQEVSDDFLGTDEEDAITDEVLETTVDKEQAQQVAAAYRAGYMQGDMVKTGDPMGMWIAIALGVGGLAVIALIAIGITVLVRRRGGGGSRPDGDAPGESAPAADGPDGKDADA